MATNDTATLTWNRNLEGDLAGYLVFVGAASGVYQVPIDVGLTATPLTPRYLVTDLASGTWFFAVKAYDTTGNQSGFSNEVNKVIRAADRLAAGVAFIA